VVRTVRTHVPFPVWFMMEGYPGSTGSTFVATLDRGPTSGKSHIDDDGSDDDLVPLLVVHNESSPTQTASAPPVDTTKSFEPTPEANGSLLSAADQHSVCPVTILTGFLGSGKTTLIQNILAATNLRIAVIENEYAQETAFSEAAAAAATSIESFIVKNGAVGRRTASVNESSSLIDLVELPNGCICCTVKESLVQALEVLIRTKGHLIDHILLECSGLVNPGPLARLFWLDDADSSGFSVQKQLALQGIVTLVDAVHIRQQLQSPTVVEASQQIAYADRILINKVDLLLHSARDQSSTSMSDIVALVRPINATAEIRTTSFACVANLDWILGPPPDANRTNSALANVPVLDRPKDGDADAIFSFHRFSACNNPQCRDPNHFANMENGHVEAAAHDGGAVDSTMSERLHEHTGGVSTITLYQKGTADYQRMNSWLADMLWPNQDMYVGDFLHLQREQLATMSGEHVEATLPNASSHSASVHNMAVSQKQQEIFRIKGILSVCNAPTSDDDFGTSVEVVDSADLERDAGPIRQEASQERLHLDPRKYIVQAVYDTWEILPAHRGTRGSTESSWVATSDRYCKMVVIGRYLDESSIETRFYSCFV
jgi:G3E family GTPase